MEDPNLSDARPAIEPRDLLYRARIGVPWVTLLLVITCFMITFAQFFFESRRDYYLTLGVGYCEEDGVVHWWHSLVAPFVHGTGCPPPVFPPLWFHISANTVLFVFQGMLTERVLGAGRTALLTFTCLAVNVVLTRLLVHGYAHGASGMTWSYLLFAMTALVVAWRSQRWRMFRDWVSTALVLTSIFAILGLLKHWHLWNLLASVPFFIAWRKTFLANTEAIARGTTPDRGSPTSNAIGIAVALALFVFNAYFFVAAMVGWIEPVSLG